MVDEVGHVHEERQQRMAVDIIARRPVAHHAIRDGVEARDVELRDEQMPVVGVLRCEHVVVLADDEGVEGKEHQEHHRRQRAFFALHAEEAERTEEGVAIHIVCCFFFLLFIYFF